MRSILATFAAAILSSSTPAAEPRPLAKQLPPGHPSCHARKFSEAELAAHPDRRVTAISLERSARDIAVERKLGALEQFDDTPVVSATLRVRLRADPLTHAARLECTDVDERFLVCTSPVCPGGEIRIDGDGPDAIAISVGGTLKDGRFIGHYIHLDESCEGRAGGPVVLESGEDDRLFSLAPAPKEVCR